MGHLIQSDGQIRSLRPKRHHVAAPKKEREPEWLKPACIFAIIIALVMLLLAAFPPSTGAQEEILDPYAGGVVEETLTREPPVQIPPCDPRVQITIVTNRPLTADPVFVCHPTDDPSLVQQVVVQCMARHQITQAVVTVWEVGTFDGWVAVYLEVPCGAGNYEGNVEQPCNSSEAGALIINSTDYGATSQPRFKCSGY